MFLHSVAVQDQLISADGIFTFDLAVNPLSMVLIALRPLNDTGTLTNFASYRNVAAAMNRASILYRGESVFSMRGEDLAALNYFRWGIQWYQGQHDDVNDERRCVVVPILMGRFPYSKKSCFPASRRGELVLELDLDIADTGYDGLRLSVEAVELLDAKPSEFEKKVQITQTWAATGDQDFDLPPGNVCRGLLLFGTTAFGGASPAPSWGRVKTLLDNQEVGYAASDFEVAQGLHCLWGRQPPTYDAHKHNVPAGTDAGGGATTAGPVDIGEGYEQYAFLDFDPTGNDEHSIDTRNKSRFHARSTAETADLVRVIPIEVIKT